MRWISKKHNWHRWFAWWPITITNQATNADTTIWWEHIARKEIMGHDQPYYIYNPDPDFKGDE